MKERSLEGLLKCADVDDPESLYRLCAELNRRGYHGPALDEMSDVEKAIAYVVKRQEDLVLRVGKKVHFVWKEDWVTRNVCGTFPSGAYQCVSRTDLEKFGPDRLCKLCVAAFKDKVARGRR